MDVVSRRLELLKLEGLGLSQPEIVKELAQKYGRSERSIYYDFESRGVWQVQFSQLQDVQKAALIVHNKLDYIYRKASFMAVSGPEMSRVAALRVMLDVVSRQAELSGVGANPPGATGKIEVTASWRNKHNMTPEEIQRAEDIQKTLKEYNEVVEAAAQLNVVAEKVADRYIKVEVVENKPQTEEVANSGQGS